jgi:hypothetical protein
MATGRFHLCGCDARPACGVSRRFYALKSDGSVQVFAGTSLGLYRLNNTDAELGSGQPGDDGPRSGASPGVVTRPRTAPRSTTPRCSRTPAARCRLRLRPGRPTTSRPVLTANTYTISATPGGTAINTATTGSGHAFRYLTLSGAQLERAMAVCANRQSGVCDPGQRRLAGLRPVLRKRPSRTRWEALRRPPISPSSAAFSCSPGFSRSPTACNGRVEQLQRLDLVG